MQIWILTKTTDIDPTQILGAYDQQPGTRRFAEEATRMLEAAARSLYGEGGEPIPDPLAVCGRGEDGSLNLTVRDDLLALEPIEYVTA